MEIHNYISTFPTQIYVNGVHIDLYAISGTHLSREEAADLACFIAKVPRVLDYLQKELAQPYITERDKRIMRSKIEELLNLIR